MRRFLFVALVLVAPVVLAQSASGPSATDLYHGAAQAYIDGETEQAVREAEQALALDPDNEKIQRLLDLLRQEQPPQNDEDGQQDEPQDSGNEGEPDESESDDSQQNQSNEGEQDREEAERDGTDQSPPDESQADDAQDGREDERQPPSEPTPADTGQPRPTEMSAVQAQRLLDAIAADEELLVEKMRRPMRGRRSDRDW